MRVIAVDPGYDRIGVAILEPNNGKESLLFSTCILTNKKSTLPERLHQLGNEFESILNTYQPTALAIETLFFNKNTTTAIGVAASRGVIIYLAQNHHCQVFEFSPQAVKIATTGYGNSDKAAVTMMVQRLVPEVPKKALDDEYDAIAVGITCLAHNQQNR